MDEKTRAVCWSISCLLLLVHRTQAKQFIEPCNDTIFCTGEILKVVQLSHAFPDAKTFVDMPLTKNRSEILPILKAKLNTSSTKAEVLEVVEEYFSPEGTELRYVTPSDWKPNPAIFSRIKDPNYLAFARRIHEIWKTLTREIIPEVREQPSLYTLLYSPHPFVVPGGRFREFYYWDTYWVIKGLLLSDMADTVKGMLLNFVDLVKTYGKIPNGGRKYYLNRSQPPFLTLMVRQYYLSTKDLDLVKQVMGSLEEEYSFWMKNRTVKVVLPGDTNQYILNRYATPMGSPRPESYPQDVETVRQSGVKDPIAQQELYAHIASAAESGWDFSSRWFAAKGPGASKMTTIRTRNIIPLDLNSILFVVERTLYEFANVTGRTDLVAKYRTAFERRKVAVEAVFWDEGFGQWVDFDLETQSRRNSFYASNIFPLWAGCHGLNATRSQLNLDSLKRQGVFKYVAGIPTSLLESGQQWDYPNAWPPLQDVVEEALRGTGLEEGRTLAFELAKKWLETNYISWKETGHMYEKYDVNVRGKPGHGGEYDVQVGFGWSNAVVLEFLSRYGQELKAPPASGSTSLQMLNFLYVLIMSVSAIRMM